MKEITKYNRLSGYFNLIYDRLNERFFDNVLVRPVITIQATSRAYAHYTPWDAWSVDGVGNREINIGAGTLDRPLENVIASMLHEMCHQYNDQIIEVRDTSRNGTYHNRIFYDTATAHGLNCYHVATYGYAKTEPSDELLDFILENNDFKEIKINRNDYDSTATTGRKPTSRTSGDETTVIIKRKSNSRRYICPCCRDTLVRATKSVNIICGNCMTQMIEG